MKFETLNKCAIIQKPFDYFLKNESLKVIWLPTSSGWVKMKVWKVDFGGGWKWRGVMTQAFWSSIARTHWFWCFSVPELASNGVYWSCNNLQIPLWPFSLGSFCIFLSAMNSTFRNQCKPAPKIGFGPTLTFRSHLWIYNSSWMILSWCPMILQSPSTGAMADLETGFQLCFLKEWSLTTL